MPLFRSDVKVPPFALLKRFALTYLLVVAVFSAGGWLTLRFEELRRIQRAEDSETSRSAFKAALEQIDQIKSSLRDIIGELSEAMTRLKSAEKEQRVSAKEIETFRAKLREIQSVEI